jgi:type I restriction enzyme S subunit
MKFIKFSQILDFQKKSQFKAGEGLANGTFPFFTSSSTLSKYTEFAQFTSPSIIFGTGGSASVHVCDQPFSVSTDCLVAQIKPELSKKFVIKFIYYYLFKNIWILEKGFKGAGLKHISKSYINDISIPEFSLEDQKRIVKILDTADALRQKRKQAITLLDDYLRSVFLEMFGDPVTNSKKIKKAKIKDIGQVFTGNTPPRNEAKNYGSFIEWIKSDNINNSGHYLTKASEFLSESGSKKARIVPSGSILVTCIAGSISCIGNVGITNRKVAFNQQINAIVPNSDVDQRFLYSQILFNKELFQKASTNSMKGMLNKSKFSEIELLKPDFILQKKYADLFLKTESIKQKMLIQSQELETQFQALMQKAFKGEL